MKGFRLFRRNDDRHAPLPAASLEVSIPVGMAQPQPAAKLLGTPRRKRLLEHIWQRTAVSREQFDALYLAPIGRYADLVQGIPASESHHHAWPGGMLDHGLEAVAYALKLRQSRLLPAGSAPEAQAAQAEAWTAAVAYGALLHDVGKVAVDVHVEYADGTVWHPWHGPMAQPYRFRHVKGREYRLHGAAAGLVYASILGRAGLDWLSGFPELWALFLYVLAGQHEHAGILGEIITQADKASVAQALGANPARAMAAPKHAIQKKLLDGLRYLIREAFKLNQPQASDGWLTQDALWLVSKTVADKLRAHLLSQGFEGIPSSNPSLFNILQEHGIIQAAPGGKAIWRATVKGENGWSHAFTFLRLSPALVWEPDQRPKPFAGVLSTAEETEEKAAPIAQPNKRAEKINAPNTPKNALDEETEDSSEEIKDEADFTEMPFEFNPFSSEIKEGEEGDSSVSMLLEEPAFRSGSHSAIKTDQAGEHFVEWLRQGLAQYRFTTNSTDSFVHAVDGTAFIVTPKVFKRYVYEHPLVKMRAEAEQIEDWQWVQRQFMRLGVHRRKQDGLHIWACKVYGPQRPGNQLSGYLFLDPKAIFSDVPGNNPFLRLERE
jgi:integrating conjugative element relaxase (TIGR03760 family)